MAKPQTPDQTNQDERKVGRKRLLAAVLLLTMFALVGRAVYIFWQEGDKLCQALQGELAQFPAGQKPCTKKTFLVGHFDWPAFRVSGANVSPSAVRYQFDDEGDIHRVDTDLGDDGTTEISYRCSTLGKILMPMTNYAAWTSYSTFEGLAQGSRVPTERFKDDGGKGVRGLHTRLTVVGEPGSSHTMIVKSSTRDADERLHRKVHQGMAPGQLTILDYEYDARGNVSSRRQTMVDHPYSVTRQTDYTYECWE